MTDGTLRPGALAGARVFVPRGGAWGERVSREIERRGAHAVVAPVIGSAPPRDIVARDRTFAALAAGEYEWLFVTSAAGVEQLVAHGITLPPATQVATVGPATARALTEMGATVAFVPTGRSSAATMIAQWGVGRAAATTGRCLVLRSDLAAAVVSDELEVQGHAVDVCIGYRTVGIDLPPETVEALRTGSFDVVLLTSLSVARELRRQVGVLDARTLFASIGPGTTKDARHLGFDVGHTAHTQTVDALLAELDARSGSEDPR
ncbi:uroporphyrinogen-III synthase [Microbacterium memoriense]|uniref:Uroporphyrinogen-III synthase n=1 Tax=Microbacterium memoriense TaxID=2978350 RepID=A0ABT2P8R1_9MICO|nr:uroporphyrinogen-III synthase [Microbacterium memoriense]MCT9000940.1 uroporphyrinogen-III synthase [Microbacterium memoriense]